MTQRTHQITRATVLCAVLAMTMLAGCGNPDPPAGPATFTPPTTASHLALALLEKSEVHALSGAANLAPQAIQFMGNLDPAPGTQFYVVRTWMNRLDYSTGIVNAITHCNSAASAQALMHSKAAGKQLLSGVPSIGDATVAYYEPASDGDGASVTVRFTTGADMVKVQVYAAAQNVAQDGATKLAQAQLEKMKSAAVGASSLATTDSLQKVPTQVAGTSLLGVGPVSGEEWDAFDPSSVNRTQIPNLLDAAQSAFVVDQRNETLYVTLFHFSSADAAKTFQREMPAETTPEQVVKLPTDLSAFADAAEWANGITELQAYRGTYVYDVSLSTPFEPTQGDPHAEVAAYARVVLAAVPAAS